VEINILKKLKIKNVQNVIKIAKSALFNQIYAPLAIKELFLIKTNALRFAPLANFQILITICVKIVIINAPGALTNKFVKNVIMDIFLPMEICKKKYI
jgi:hypothetical protein